MAKTKEQLKDKASIGQYTETKRKKMLKEEQQRLEVIKDRFSDDSHRALVENLLNDIAFMTVEMSEAKAIVQKTGLVEEYKNGANQMGYKKSSAIETYDKLVNSRLRCIKQIADMMPPPAISPTAGAEETPEESLRKFIAGG